MSMHIRKFVQACLPVYTSDDTRVPMNGHTHVHTPCPRIFRYVCPHSYAHVHGRVTCVGLHKAWWLSSNSAGGERAVGRSGIRERSLGLHGRTETQTHGRTRTHRRTDGCGLAGRAGVWTCLWMIIVIRSGMRHSMCMHLCAEMRIDRGIDRRGREVG